MQNHPQVASIQLDKQRKLSLAESIPHIQADAVHARPYTGKGITVAVLDTGIDTDHPDLADSIVAQHCFSQASCPPNDTNESESAEDDIFGGGHGTHVAGIITSPRGVAPDVGIVAIKVFSNLSVFSVPLDSDILAGLDWIRAHLSTQPVHIISLSFGGGAFSNICDDENPAYADIFKQLRAKGIAIFVAAGNEGSKNEIAAPACLNEAIAVGATTLSDNIASFSNSNNLVDILAPGVGITSSLIGGGYITQSGTSAATPMAAGVAALMLQANPALTPNLIEIIMENSGVIVTDGLTFPRVNALAAVEMAHQSNVAFDFAAKGYKIDETGGAVTIEVSRLGSDNGRVSVEYATVDGTATAGNDYIATSGTLTWEHGDTSNKSFVVNILDNSEIFEKAFLVSLQTPTRHQATVTILDDDFAGSLEVTGVSEQTFIDDFFVFNIRHGVEENAKSITIEVARQEGSKGVVSIDYATVDGSATKSGQ
ncbi:MAG: S8 family serine peptidase [Pseudomonadota bacterium]